MQDSKIKKQIEEARISPYNEELASPGLIFIDDLAFGTLGNFSCITGKSKSRKTFFIQLLVAPVLRAIRGLDNEGRITSSATKGIIVHFDTEQSRHDTQRTAKRIITLLDSEEEVVEYRCYCLRPFSPKERRQIIDEVLRTTPGVILVVIDGVADLSVGYNNEEEASKVITDLLKWTAIHNIHLITIIHQNKADVNAKGHLGSYVLQKAETVLSIEKDGTISRVIPTHSRGQDVNPINFVIDEDGLPVITDFNPAPARSSRIRKPHDLPPETHIEILKDTFDDKKELTSSQFCDNLKFVLGRYNTNAGNSAIRDWKIYYVRMGWIVKENQQAPFGLSELVG